MAAKKVNLPSRRVYARMRLAKKVLSAIDKHSSRVSAELDKHPVTMLATDPPWSYGTVFADLQGRLQETRDQMVEVDRRHRDEAAETEIARNVRDDAAAALRHEVIGIRDIVDDVYGEDVSRQLGFARQTPRAAEMLAEQVAHLVVRLGTADSEILEPRFGATPLDLSRHVARLTRAYKRLQLMLAEVESKERDTEHAKVDRDAMLETFDRTCIDVSRMIESLFRMAGFDKLADRVRPPVSGTAVVPVSDDDDEPAEEPDDESTDL